METTEQTTEDANKTVEENALVTWEAPDLIEHTRGWEYFTGFTVFFLVLIGYFIFTRDWFAVVILVLLPALIIFYQKQRKPEIKTYTVTQLGVYENDLFYPYNEIYSFWLNTKQDHGTLNIIFSKKYLPQLTILIREIDPYKVKQVLLKYIPEEASRTESIMDKMARWLKI